MICIVIDQLKQRINNPLNFILVVMRGLPGSGKSFMAKYIYAIFVVVLLVFNINKYSLFKSFYFHRALGGIRAIRCSADDYFIKDGK